MNCAPERIEKLERTIAELEEKLIPLRILYALPKHPQRATPLQHVAHDKYVCKDEKKLTAAKAKLQLIDKALEEKRAHAEIMERRKAYRLQIKMEDAREKVKKAEK